MTWLTSWRLALRLARRDLLKHKARAIIALVMVTLPVFGVITADILAATTSVSTVEGVDRQLGTVATAAVRLGGDRQLEQGSDPSAGWSTGKKLDRPTSQADIEQVIGPRTMQPIDLGTDVLAQTSHGRELARGDQVDPSAPLAAGLYRLVAGRWPSAPDQVVVNQALRDRGIGDTLRVVTRDSREHEMHVVGTIQDASTRTYPVVVGLPGWLPSTPIVGDMGTGPTGVLHGAGWLIDGPRITVDQLHALNNLGVFVSDRVMITHPGDFDDGGFGGNGDDETAQVIALIVVMALIEVVLLAGPAFAVGARKQQRTLALVVSSGGTPTQARRVIVAGGWLLGLSAGLVGVVLGIGAAWALRPVAQRFSDAWLGPFQIPWWPLAAVALFGLVSALVACVVPAWIASRQNVVAVLAGRRGDAKPVRAFPWIGLVLFGIGIAVAVEGTRPTGGELTISWAAVICVLGMVLLVPVVVSWVARMAGRFPLPVRFAARDAVRHRTRTTPAVAAVAATVAGVVALGISTTSDEKENRATYTPTLLMGDAAVTAQPYNDFGDPTGRPTDWRAVEAAVRAQAPDAKITRVAGVQDEYSPRSWTEVQFRDPAAARGDDGSIGPDSWTSVYGSDVLVSDGSKDLPGLVTELAPDAAAALRAGKAVVFTSDPSATKLDSVVIRVVRDAEGSRERERSTVTVPAMVVQTRPGVASLHAVLPPHLAQEAGVPIATMGLDVTQPGLSKDQEKNLNATLLALPTPASISVERGYQPSSDIAIIQALLLALAAVLMLGGTLTAMFLALSDARPDLATLAAVGAEARVRRKVAAAYTFVVAFVGAVLGMVVGFVPGIAVTRPLTTNGAGPGGTGPFLAIPWLLIVAVVVGLPVLTSLIVGACVRSRLPLVSRLS